MGVLVYLVTKGGYAPQNLYERQAVKYKKLLFKITLFFAALMTLFYWRHNEYCEPYVYSFFCMCEYICVLANMAFHMTAYYDFYSSELVVSKSGRSGYQSLTSVASTH